MRKHHPIEVLAATATYQRAAPWLQRQLRAELADDRPLSAEPRRVYDRVAAELAATAATGTPPREEVVASKTTA